MSMKNSIDTIGNRTRDLEISGAVPHPTAPPPAHQAVVTQTKIENTESEGPNPTEIKTTEAVVCVA
jgi:hypothetical protein